MQMSEAQRGVQRGAPPHGRVTKQAKRKRVRRQVRIHHAEAENQPLRCRWLATRGERGVVLPLVDVFDHTGFDPSTNVSM